MWEAYLSPEQLSVFAGLPDEEQMRLLRAMTPKEVLRFDASFEQWRHAGQAPPRAEGWRTWLMLAGRGYGKTRAGAEWITRLANQRLRPVRIALVGANPEEVRKVMIEGESGLLAVGDNYGCRPRWEPGLGRLRWRGGSEACIYSGADPDSLRGPQHHYAWCDEIAKWQRPEEAWTNLQLTLRLGERPRALVTTTPRPIPLLKAIEADTALCVTTRGRTADNAHLPESFVEAMVATYGGTRLGRQELDGETLEDADGALWSRKLIERSRQSGTLARDYVRIVIGVDPPASAHGDACGIVAVGLGRDGIGYVIGDHTVAGRTPEGWATAVADAYALHDADRVVAEKNNGGEMVESVLRAADAGLPVRLVHASRGKAARAEPVAALFEKGKARFAGRFPELEDELAGMTAGGGYDGPGRSPDRADAMVWALTELMLKKERVFRITML
ncbi:MAG TPA: terminase family protein [Allosphingosinicella sp.]|uniref:DNA-packaging protein n=1 Tax=Allosphingosinicella sp. TaxID=2823234 RepID=UPI002ED99C14